MIITTLVCIYYPSRKNYGVSFPGTFLLTIKDKKAQRSFIYPLRVKFMIIELSLYRRQHVGALANMGFIALKFSGDYLLYVPVNRRYHPGECLFQYGLKNKQEDFRPPIRAIQPTS